MPHKHRRKDDDDKNFNLAPNRVAKPLPAYAKNRKDLQKDKDRKQSLKRKRLNTTSEYKDDDTPRAFARLMQLSSGQRLQSGLDNGEAPGKKKKRKSNQDAAQAAATAESSTNVPGSETGKQLKIMPGEKMADFAARVNQALPMAGLEQRRKHVEGIKERQTKTEKRLHKMYAEWRKEEARRKEALEEFREQQEEGDEEKDAEFGGQNTRLESSRRKGKRRRIIGEVVDEDDDPWAVLNAKRQAPKGLHDVVQAPPTMTVVPKEKFKVHNGAKVNIANVPSAAGSLKRREELGEARKEVIERYRVMMKGGGRL